MKNNRFLIVFITIFFLSFFSTQFDFSFSSNFQKQKANATISKYITYNYAQIKNNYTYLFKTNENYSLQNVLFKLPKSYFVLLISNYDENFYKVQYRDEIGFVLKEDVTPINETPSTPYLEDITFRIYTSDGTNIFSSPFNSDDNKNIVKTTNVLDSLNYYGEIEGDEYVKDRGRTWYYAKYTSSDGITYKGYVYSGYCDNKTQINEILDTFTVLENPFEDNDDDYLYNLINMSTPLKITLVIMLTIPCLLLVYLLFKPYKIQKSKLQRIKMKNSKTTKNQTLNKIQKILEEDDTI